MPNPTPESFRAAVAKIAKPGNVNTAYVGEALAVILDGLRDRTLQPYQALQRLADLSAYFESRARSICPDPSPSGDAYQALDPYARQTHGAYIMGWVLCRELGKTL